MNDNSHPWFPAETYRPFIIGPLPLQYEYDPEMYCDLIVSGEPIMNYFHNCPLIEMSRAHLCWGAIHICLFMYHARVFPTYEDVYILKALLDRFNPKITEALNKEEDLIYLYHSVVGHFGYVNVEQTFYFTILAFYHRLMGDQLNDEDKLILLVDFNHTELSHPFLQ